MPQRDPHIDNVKGLLIYCVVLGHLIYPVPSPNDAADTLYVFLYMFHMPMFALVSGFLSHATLSTEQLVKGGKQLLVPYVVFVCIEWGMMWAMGEKPVPLQEGQFGLWFLLSLFCWCVLLPVVMRLPYPLLFAVSACLLCGFVPQIGLDFSLARTINFMPFFLVGYLLRKRSTSPAATMSRAAGVCILSISVMAAAFLSTGNVHNTLYAAHSYEALGVPLWIGPLLRGVHLMLAFLIGLAFLAVTPKRSSLLSRFGRNSLYIYLLHSLLLVLYRSWPGGYEILGSQSLMLIPLAFGICWVLSTQRVLSWTRWLIAPYSRR